MPVAVTEKVAKIPANGHPKTGTHALCKAVQLLGMPSEVTHLPYSDKPEGKSICTFRNPRNVIISWLRFTGRPVTQGMIIEQIRGHADKGIVDSCSEYTDYLSDDSVLCVKYEDLLSDGGETVKAIAQYLNVPFLDDAYENIPGLTMTWTGNPSGWTECWTEEVDRVWIDCGGPELEAAWKY